MMNSKQRLTPTNTEGAARVINRTQGAVRQLVARRQIPFRKCGKSVVFFEEELLDWMDSQPGVRLEEVLNAK